MYLCIRLIKSHSNWFDYISFILHFFSENVCTFEDPNACETFVSLCSDEAAVTPSTHLSTGMFETGDWVIHDHTVESTRGKNKCMSVTEAFTTC